MALLENAIRPVQYPSYLPKANGVLHGGDLYLTYYLLYLDDIIIFSSSYEEQFVRMEAVFRHLKEVGLKLKRSKCHFFQCSIRYLGHVVSEDRVSTDPDKVSVVKSWPVPKSASEVQSFLGFVGFYHRFVRGFSKIARPLHQLTQGLNQRGKKSKKQGTANPFHWEIEHQEAFNQLIDCVTSAPVLGFANHRYPFEFYTDASGEVLGAVLYQTVDDKKRVIAFASRSLSKSERIYPAHKLEFLALKWAVCGKFHDYLYGNTFTAFLDNNPLTYVMHKARLDATGHRWVSQLSDYNFTIKYHSGKQNIDADSLSRLKVSDDLRHPVQSEVV